MLADASFAISRIETSTRPTKGQAQGSAGGARLRESTGRIRVQGTEMGRVGFVGGTFAEDENMCECNRRRAPDTALVIQPYVR